VSSLRVDPNRHRVEFSPEGLLPEVWNVVDTRR
jgi:hypothetical protein